MDKPFLEDSRSRGGRFALRTRQFASKLYGFLGKPALGALRAQPPLKNVAIAHAKHSDGGKRERAVDFIGSLKVLSVSKNIFEIGKSTAQDWTNHF